MRRLIDKDPLTGIEVWYDFERDTQKATITHQQDVSAIIDANKRAANDDDKTKRGIKRDWWKYASIPDVVWIDWRQRLGIDIWNPAHKDAVFKLINSPEYKYLKATAKHHA